MQHRLLSGMYNNNNNNDTIWGGSVLTGEEPPPHSGELKHALPQAGGPTQSHPSRPVSSGHHISMEYRLRRRHLLLNPGTNARKEKQTRKTLKKEKKKRKKRRTRTKKKSKENKTEEKREEQKNEKRPQRGGSALQFEQLNFCWKCCQIIQHLRLPKNQILKTKTKRKKKKRERQTKKRKNKFSVNFRVKKMKGNDRKREHGIK